MKILSKTEVSFVYLASHTYFLLFALFVSGSLFGQPKIGEKAPEIALPDVKGSIRKLTENGNKVVLVDFWASWCGPCRRSNSGLVKLYAKYKQKGFEIFGISLDEDKSSWKKAIATDKIGWTQVIDKGGWDGPIVSAWKIEQLPTSYLINKAGRVVAIDPFGKGLEQKIIRELKK